MVIAIIKYFIPSMQVSVIHKPYCPQPKEEHRNTPVVK